MKLGEKDFTINLFRTLTNAPQCKGPLFSEIVPVGQWILMPETGFSLREENCSWSQDPLTLLKKDSLYRPARVIEMTVGLEMNRLKNGEYTYRDDSNRCIDMIPVCIHGGGTDYGPSYDDRYVIVGYWGLRYVGIGTIESNRREDDLKLAVVVDLDKSVSELGHLMKS